MGSSPTKAANNIYCRCRKEAAKFNDKLNSREGAAELLGVSTSSLADYELGITKIVPVDKILRMADLYNAPEIINYYCREVCPLGADVPKIVCEDLDRIVVKTVSRLRKASDIKEKLLDITEDGLISEDETRDLEKIMNDLDEIAILAQSLKMWVQKNGGGNCERECVY